MNEEDIMSADQTTICPVCGAPQSVMKEYDCGTCGFAAAYIPFFAGEKSWALWQQQAERAREARKPARKQLSLYPAGSLCLDGSCVAFRDGPQKRIYIATGAGMAQRQENAVEFSVGQRNYAVLYADGTVRVFGGENSYGQCDTGDWRGITSVLSGPNCTCGVTKDCSILVRGARAIQGLDRWTGVKKLVCGTNHVVGLRTDGQVLAAGDRERPFFEKIRSWKHVTDIAAARGCALALRQDGTAVFAGKPGDDREAVEGHHRHCAGQQLRLRPGPGGQNVHRRKLFGPAGSGPFRNVRLEGAGGRGRQPERRGRGGPDRCAEVCRNGLRRF